MSRQKRAVIVGLEKTGNGQLRITLDDLVQSKEPSTWTKDVSITFKDYENETFDELNFDEKELADFGYYIIARLHAFYKQGEI